MKHTLFFIKKFRHQFFNIANSDIVKNSNLYFIINISLLILFYLRLKDNYCLVQAILLNIHDRLLKHNFLNYCWYFIKVKVFNFTTGILYSNSATFICNPINTFLNKINIYNIIKFRYLFKSTRIVCNLVLSDLSARAFKLFKGVGIDFNLSISILQHLILTQP